MIRFILAEKWSGLDDLAEKELKAARLPAEKVVLKCLLLFEREVKKKLIGPRTGRMYGTHQASAPGEPPALLDGDLRKSITHDGPTWSGDEISGEVGSSLEKAALLEFGGMTGRGHLTRILPRPYMGATFLEQFDRMQAILAEAVNK
jgi:phage gpG-like protein